SIGEGAFGRCVMLMFVCINANMSNSSSTSDILELEDSAFDGCQRLGRIIVPNDDYIYNEYVAEFEAQGFEDMVVRETAGLNFTLLENGTYEVSKGADPLVGEIIIPSMYNGEPVTRIADNGFINCAIEDVIVPSSIEAIGESAFANCDNLGMAILLRTAAEGITDISATAFEGSDNVCFRVYDEASYYAYYNDLVSKGEEELAEYIQFIMYI
ncbi:MAG: leucine-rich repeat protein, partial [Clostridia bacterium]|nr:leucine-rich repeat protein [Clostridia bacterium]